MKITSERLKQELSTIVDPFLARQLVTSYTEMMQRFYAGDWKPSELDGGQFSEAVGRALYQVDTGIFSDRLLPNMVVKELKNNSIKHNLQSKDRDHFGLILQTTYNFRNNRGVAHISPIYNANHSDAMLVVANVKWMFAEFLFLAWNKDRKEVAAIIESIIRLEHPLIYELDGRSLVLTTSLSTTEEILMLLQHSMTGGTTRTELKQSILKDQSTINKAISRLIAEKKVWTNTAGDIVVTPLGQKYVHEEIIPKLTSNNGRK